MKYWSWSLIIAMVMYAQVHGEFLQSMIDQLQLPGYPIHATSYQETPRRRSPAYYTDQTDAMMEGLPSPRQVSNLLIDQATDMPNPYGFNSFLWQWGQFLDHDITLSDHGHTGESVPITVPLGDPQFDPYQTGQATIPFTRSTYLRDANGARQQTNTTSSLIDASMVYGRSLSHQNTLRSFDGTGKLLTSYSENNEILMPIDSGQRGIEFVAGDPRANEQLGLIAIHTLFVREHNYRADIIRHIDPGASGEVVFRSAKKLTTAIIQSITYQEYLPHVVGQIPHASKTSTTISNEFMTAAFRYGHTQLPSQLLRVNSDGETASPGPVSLAQAFFVPNEIIEHGADSILIGLSYQPAQQIDNHLVDEIRNLLFGPPGSGGMDLASLNIQRGRDHGLSPLNATRLALGLDRYDDFDDLPIDDESRIALMSLYNTVDQIELRPGGLSEMPTRGSLLGETFTTLLRQEFAMLKDNDPLFYTQQYDIETIAMIERQTLSTVLTRHTNTRFVGDAFKTGTHRPQQTYANDDNTLVEVINTNDESIYVFGVSEGDICPATRTLSKQTVLDAY